MTSANCVNPVYYYINRILIFNIKYDVIMPKSIRR
jgi:hypothetical protein